MVAAALEAALGAGLDAAGFFASTPWLTQLHVRATWRARRETALYTAWHIEALARTVELPDLSALLAEVRADDPSPAETEARRWAAVAGLVFTELAECE